MYNRDTGRPLEMIRSAGRNGRMVTFWDPVEKCYVPDRLVGGWGSGGSNCVYRIDRPNKETLEREKIEKTRQKHSELIKRALQFLEAKNYDQTITCCNEVLSTNPINVSAWSFKGYAFEGKGHYDNALSCHDEVLEISQKHSISYETIYNAWYMKFLLFEKKNNHEKVIECCQMALKYTSDNAEIENVLLRLVFASHHLNRHNNAIQYCDKILKISPNNPEAWNYKADSLYELEKHDEALECYDKHLKIRPKHSIAWSDRGLTLIKIHRYQEAIDSCDKAYALDNSCPYPLRHRGVALSALERYEEAQESFDAALRMDPNYKEAWVSKGETSIIQDDYDYPNALACFNKALSISSSYQPAKKGKEKVLKIGTDLIRNGDICFEQNNYETAIKYYDDALKITPDFARVWNVKSLILNQLGRHEESLVCSDKAFSLDESCPCPLRHKGVALTALGRYEEAHRSFDAALKMNPDYEEAWTSKGLLFNIQNDCEQALKCFEKSLSLSSTTEEAEIGKEKALHTFRLLDSLCFEGDLYFSKNDLTSALNYYEKALKTNPNFTIALRKKADVLNEMGRHEEARTCCDTILLLDRNIKSAWLNRGMALLRLNRYDEACNDLNEALSIDPMDKKALCYLAEALQMKRDYSAAIISYKRALAIDNTFEQARTGLNTAVNSYQEERKDKEALLYKGISFENGNNSSIGPYNAGFFGFGKVKVYEDAIYCYNKALGIKSCSYSRVKTILPHSIATAAVGPSDLIVEVENEQVAIYWVNGENNRLLEFEFLNKEQSRNIIQFLPKQNETSESADLICMILDACHAITSDPLLEVFIWEQKARALIQSASLIVYNVSRYYEDAIKCCNQALEIGPSFARALATKGKALHKQGNYRESITCYDKALALGPYLQQLQNDKLDVLNELKAKKQQLINEGEQLFSTGKNDAALIAYSKALDLSPEDDVLWAKKGDVLLKTFSNKEASECYSNTLTINPNQKTVWDRKAQVLTKMGLYDEAINCCDQALSLDKNFLDALKHKAVALKKNKLYDKAIECFNLFLTVKNDDIDVWNDAAEIYALLHDDAKAMYYFDNALTLNPDDADATAGKLIILKKYQFQNIQSTFITEIETYIKKLTEKIKTATFGPYTIFYNKELTTEKEKLANGLIAHLRTCGSLNEIDSALDIYLKKDMDLCVDYEISVNTFSESLQGLKQKISMALSNSTLDVLSSSTSYRRL